MIDFVKGRFKNNLMGALERVARHEATQFARILGITWFHVQRAKSADHEVHNVKRDWAESILRRFNTQITIEGQPDDSAEPIILVGNHTSYLDIPLVMLGQPRASFVSKSEVKHWPILGSAAKSVDTIFVKRESMKSRRTVMTQILDSLKTADKRLIIFPSGTTTLGPATHWKKGAFKVAAAGNIKMQMFRVSWAPARAAAYIDDDFMPTHAMRLIKTKNLTALLEFGESFYVQDIFKDLERTRTWCEAHMRG